MSNHNENSQYGSRRGQNNTPNSQHQHRRALAYAAAVLNATIIGFSFVFTKVALEYANPIDTLTYRFAVACMAMIVPLAFGWISVRADGKQFGKALLLASMYPLGFFTLQAFGLQQATSVEGGILYAFTPVLTMVLAMIFLKEKTTILQKLAVFLSVFGVVFIFLVQGNSIDVFNVTGIVLLVLSCLAFAGYSVLARSFLQNMHPVEVSCWMVLIGFVSFLATSLTIHSVSGTISELITPLTSGTFLVSILYLGVLASLVTSLTANYALSKIEASKVSVFANLSIIVSIAAGAVFLSEPFTVYHLIGSVLIIAGVVGTNLKVTLKRSRKQPK